MIYVLLCRGWLEQNVSVFLQTLQQQLCSNSAGEGRNNEGEGRRDAKPTTTNDAGNQKTEQRETRRYEEERRGTSEKDRRKEFIKSIKITKNFLDGGVPMSQEKETPTTPTTNQKGRTASQQPGEKRTRPERRSRRRGGERNNVTRQKQVKTIAKRVCSRRCTRPPNHRRKTHQGRTGKEERGRQ